MGAREKLRDRLAQEPDEPECPDDGVNGKENNAPDREHRQPKPPWHRDAERAFSGSPGDPHERSSSYPDPRTLKGAREAATTPAAMISTSTVQAACTVDLARATPKDSPMSPTGPLHDSLALLVDLRKEMENLLPAVNWVIRSHGDAEVLAFMQLAIANVAAVETLAKTNIHFVVAGTAAARDAYEEVATAAWMVGTDDLPERERRWMALFVDEQKFWRTMIDEARKRVARKDPPDKDDLAFVTNLEGQERRVKKMIASAQPQLTAAGGGEAEKMPSIEQRLTAVGQHHYLVYRTACQFTHAATRSLSLVRDLKTAHDKDIDVAAYAYRTTEADWTTAVLLAAESLAFGLETLATRMGAPPVTPRANHLFNAIADRVRTFK